MRAAQLQVLLRAVLLLVLAASPPARMQLVVIIPVVLVVVLVVVVLVPLPVGADHHLRTGPLAVAGRPVSRGSFRRSRSSLSRSST